MSRSCVAHGHCALLSQGPCVCVLGFQCSHALILLTCVHQATQHGTFAQSMQDDAGQHLPACHSMCATEQNLQPHSATAHHMPLLAVSMAACLCMTDASNLMSMVVVGLLDSLLGCSTKWADTLQDQHKWDEGR